MNSFMCTVLTDSNEIGTFPIARGKVVGEVTRTYVGSFLGTGFMN